MLLFQDLPERTDEKHKNLKIAGLWAEIKIEDLLNMKQVC
jgi:hypothetical protein